MTSTVLDATLCLVLVSAAAVTLAGAPVSDGATRRGADAAAETLATTTATVNYTLAPGARRADGTPVTFSTEHGETFRRTAHGSLAALVADAAAARVAVDGRRLSHAGANLSREVRGAVRAAVGGSHTQVVAVWRPYPGAPVEGRFVAGEAPPPDASVRAATLVAASGVDPARAEATRRARGGYGPLATFVATQTVRAIFPPDQTRLALTADYPRPALVRHRYYRAGEALGADVDDPVEEGRVRAANARLHSRLAPRIERDLRATFDSATAAARAVTVGRVRIVVRRWSA